MAVKSPRVEGFKLLAPVALAVAQVVAPGCPLRHLHLCTKLHLTDLLR